MTSLRQKRITTSASKITTGLTQHAKLQQDRRSLRHLSFEPRCYDVVKTHMDGRSSKSSTIPGGDSKVARVSGCFFHSITFTFFIS